MKVRCFTAFFLVFFTVHEGFTQKDTSLIIEDILNMSLDELLNVKVITASNVSEKFSDVPATMIVISENEISERGYTTISEVMEDLPGMDITRHYADQPFFNYWRGYRASFSQPYLVMLDGILCNDIFYNQPQIIDNLSVSSIKRIEIVYGPVSAVYGANAFMGVINIISKKERKTDGITLKSSSRISTSGDVIMDVFSMYQKGGFRTSLTFRFEDLDLTNKLNLDRYYTNTALLSDTLLWGKVATTLNRNNEVSIPYERKSFDYRIAYKEIEAGIMLNTMLSGWGLATPFDKYLANVMFPREFYHTWINHKFKFSDVLSTATSLQYVVENRSGGDWIEAYNYTNNENTDVIFQTDTVLPSETVRLIDYSIWPIKNNRFSVSQMFFIEPSNKFLITLGAEYKKTYINKQKGFFGDAFTVGTVDVASTSFYPTNGEIASQPANKVKWKDYSIFGQFKFSLNENHIFNLGFRFDENSDYGVSNTCRAGYVLKFKNSAIKFLYGQAYQVPTPRTLYSETILGSSLDLEPEKSETVELNLNYTNENISTWLSGYFINNNNTIVPVEGTAKNLGQRKVYGLDFYTNFLIPSSFLERLNFWTYFSTYLKAEENVYDDLGKYTGTKDIADLSDYKIYFGVTVNVVKNLVLNFRGRYKSERKGVSTNLTEIGDVRVVDDYFTMDANITYKNLFINGLHLAFKIENIFDKRYYHPGINEADSGTINGYWSNDSIWTGSLGWNNSLIPQAHRYATISLLLEY